MSVIKSQNTKPSKLDFSIKIVKILVISFVGLYLIGNFSPYFEGEDSFLYGLAAKNFAQGEFSITNDLLQEYGREEFTGGNWLKTIDNTAVPVSGIGLILIGAFSYVVAGEYGLFYLSPIFTIALLICSERISTSLFGKYVGLLTLLFMASSNLLIRNTARLQTESLFSLVIVIGVYFLIKYLREKDKLSLLASTGVLTYSSVIRIVGFVFLPIELIIISGFHIVEYLTQKLSQNKYKENKSKQKIKIKFSKKEIILSFIIILIPWMLFFGWWTEYNEKNFGDPFTNYGAQSKLKAYETSPLSLLEFKEEDFENIKYYSKYLLPYQFPAVQNERGDDFSEILGKNWLGIISLLIIFLTIIISIYTKNKKLEVIVLVIFILSILWFYSAITTEERAAKGAPARFMLPVFSLSSMIFSFFIVSILKTNLEKFSKNSQIIIRGLKVILIGMIGLFIIFAFYFSPPIKAINEETFDFKNPKIYSDRYPLDMEGLTKNSVIIAKQLDWALEYQVTPFSINVGPEISNESVLLLKEILKDGKEVYIFKEASESDEKELFLKLINEHDIIFKDYSKTFCKVDLNTNDNSIENVDQVCIQIEK